MKGIAVDDLRVKLSEHTKELERQLKEKDQLIENYRKDHGALEVFFDRVIRSVSPISQLPNVYDPKYGKLKVDSPVVAVAQFSDWHTGEIQEPNEIEGFNAYSPEIQDRRIDRMDEVFLNWVDYHRHAYRIDEHAILATGDLISGDIHDELRVTNAYPVPEQIVQAAQKLSRTVALRASHFAKVTVEFVSEDNHARLTKKPQAKEAGKNSYNYLVGVLAKEYLSRLSNVEFNIYPAFEKVVDVNGTKYLIGHGHGIIGWMGTPWYSIERKIGREQKARMDIIMNDRENELRRLKEIGFNKYIFGHWHTYFDNDSYACSASLSGTSAYDHQNGRHGRPGQSSWMVHSKRGEFDKIPIKLDFI